jgi:hypothetical protein
MSDSYDIYYAGDIVEGASEASVRDNLARLFKANAQTLEKLFSGKPQLVKRGLDRETALKYKKALLKAGAIPVIRRAETAQHTAPPPASADAGLPSSKAIGADAPHSAPATSSSATGTLADRLAALTGESEPSADAVTPDWTQAKEVAAPPVPAGPEAPIEYQLSLAPIGSDVLREYERQLVEELEIDTTAIEMAEPGDETPLEPPAPTPPPAPDTGHISMGEVGDDIPHLDVPVIPLDPDTSHLSMGEVGEVIPHLEEHREIVNPDISAIHLAPAGSDVLEEQYRRRESVAPPNTDHLALA